MTDGNRNPSEVYDKLINTTWLMESVDEETKELRLEIVPNRAVSTMKRYFKKTYKKRSDMFDGWA